MLCRVWRRTGTPTATGSLAVCCVKMVLPDGVVSAGRGSSQWVTAAPSVAAFVCSFLADASVVYHTRLVTTLASVQQGICPPLVRFGPRSGVLLGASRGHRRGVLVAGAAGAASS